jgi:hypothetical protein
MFLSRQGSRFLSRAAMNSNNVVLRRRTSTSILSSSTSSLSSLMMTGSLPRRNSSSSSSTTTTTTLKESYDNIIVESSPEGGNGKIAIIKLNRPKALNALNDELFTDLIHATNAINNDNNVRCLILTGSTSKAFAAGADISEMKDKNFEDVYRNDMFAEWQDISKCSASTPIIAAISGYCLGGGNELAMMCDIMVCTKNAKVRLRLRFVFLFVVVVVVVVVSSSSRPIKYLLTNLLTYSVFFHFTKVRTTRDKSWNYSRYV